MKMTTNNEKYKSIFYVGENKENDYGNNRKNVNLSDF